MVGASLLAAAATILGVAAAWDLISSIEHARILNRLKQILGPLTRAKVEGTEPTGPERGKLLTLITVAVFVVGVVFGGVLLGLVLVLVTPAAVIAFIRVRQHRYRSLVRQSAPMFARVMADALRAGFSIRRAVGESATALDGPIANELSMAARALELGDRTETVLGKLRMRARSPEFDSLVAAILLQRDAGGDLAALLTDLALTMEESVRLRREAKTATSQARFSAGVVLVLPLAAVVIGEMASPGFLAGMASNPISMMMLVVSLVLQLVGVISVGMLARVPK